MVGWNFLLPLESVKGRMAMEGATMADWSDCLCFYPIGYFG